MYHDYDITEYCSDWIKRQVSTFFIISLHQLYYPAEDRYKVEISFVGFFHTKNNSFSIKKTKNIYTIKEAHTTFPL